MNSEDLLRKVQVYFSGRDDTHAVYLFGSYAKGTANGESDLDLAVLFTETEDPVLRFRLKLQIANDLEDLLGKKVDVVDLRSADLCFIRQIMLCKVLIYEQDRHDRIAFEVAYRKRYFDHLPILEQYHAKARERILRRETKHHG